MALVLRPQLGAGIEDVCVRQAREDDLPALEWEGQFQRYRRLYQDAYRRSKHGLVVMWVAELDQRLIGQVFIQLKCDRPELCDGSERAYLYAFRVRPEYRSKGLGRYMVQVVEKDLLSRGFSWLTLNVARDNPDAMRLYRRLGFRIVAPEAGEWQYIDHQGCLVEVQEPAWRMEKRL